MSFLLGVQSDSSKTGVDFKGEIVRFTRLTFYLLWIGIGTLSVSGQIVPRLSMKVGTNNKEISNLDLINVEASAELKGFDLNSAQITTTKPTKPGAGLTLVIWATELRSGNKTEIPIQVTGHGSGRQYDRSSVYLFIYIPVDPKVRDAETKKYLAWVKSTADAGTDPHVKEMYDNPNTLAFLEKQMEGLYRENKAGDFELHCQLISGSGNWQGVVECPVTPFTIAFKGHFFDQKRFRSKK